MSSLVVFSTSTGNTKKIADAIFSALKDKDKKITDVNEINTININEFERIIIGGWIDKGEIDEKAKELMDPEVTSDETFYPSEEVIQSLEHYEFLGNEWITKYNEAFLDFKMGL